MYGQAALQNHQKKYGKHLTQKPLYLLERIIEASTKEGDIVWTRLQEHQQQALQL